MSFFGNNNNNTSGGFGGFGASTNNTSGGFGATSSSGGMFGSTTATSGGFGTGGGGGFGATNTNSPFGAAKTTGFGAPATTSAGGMFGNSTSTSGGFGTGGGFGATNTASTGFGGGNTGGKFAHNLATYPKPANKAATAPASAHGHGNRKGNEANVRTGGLFGTNKPATSGFGASNTGGSIFGGGSNTTGGFGNTANTGSSLFGSNNNATATNTTGGFGNNAGATSTGFGGFGASTNANANNNNGTAATPFQAYSEKDAAANQTSYYQSLTFQQPYQNKSFEELRTEDYLQGRKFGNTNGQAGSFGTSTGFGGSVFGGNQSNTTNTQNAGGLFGSNNNNNNNATNTGTSGFGGFGANNTSNTTSAFGNNTAGSSLFGNQNKPATGGVFGNTAASGTTTNAFGSTATNTGGGLFGSGTGGGFGANNNNAANTSGGLFGNTAQPKPAFGGFGGTNTTGGFGNTNTSTGGGLFGGGTANTNTGGGLFGSNNQQQTQPQQQQPQQGNNLFGSSTNNAGGLFGNQNKPATGGLFGGSANTNTGGGLFGSNTNNTQQSGGLFGSTNNNNNNTGGGLFGNNQQQNKPAGGGLFGNSTANTNTGGGLFGNSNTQQFSGGLFGNNTNNNNAGGSLFGNSQSKPATGGLFGNSTNTNTGGGLSLFGGNNQQNQQNNGGSLFGNMGQNNQNQQANNTSSLFGAGSQQINNQQSQPNQLHASLTSAPYGNEQLFGSLGAASPPVGPLATPLNGAKPPQSKTPSLLASTRVNSPVYTPRNGSIGRNGYGLNYSTYGTPGSAYSVNLTPGASSLLKPTGSLSSALTSRLAKSISMSSLRGDGTLKDGESLLRPTPGSSSSRYVATGSMRRLNIDRSLRTDLFSPPENKQLESLKDGDRGLKKQVSFDNSADATTTAAPSASNALVRTEDEAQEHSSPGLVKAGPRSYPDISGASEMEQTNGTLSLTTVSEGHETTRQSAAASSKRFSDGALLDAAPGEYWTKPALKDLKQMSRAQLSKMGGLTVGRENVGRIEFGPCDLTSVPLDDICGNIVKLTTRIATVYEEESDKPAMGKGLNVPSTIHLERSWPRSNGGKKLVLAKQGKEYDKHIARLKRVHNTNFKNYDPDTGVWTFTVEHFTTYGLEDDDEDMTDQLPETSELSDPPATPGLQDGDTLQSFDTSTGQVEDDTFQFKLDQRAQSSPAGNMQVPGSIEGISYDYDDPSADEGTEEDDLGMSGGMREVDLEDPFVSPDVAVEAPPLGAAQRFQSSMAHGDDIDDFEIAEQMQAEPEPALPGSFNAEEPKLLRSILKPTPALRSFMSPEKLTTTSWEDQLQQTISPRKRDRQALRDLQMSAMKAPEDDLGESLFKRSMLDRTALDQSYLAQKSAKKVGFGPSTMSTQKGDLGKSQAFRTSMDIMNSLWAQEKPSKKAAATTKGFENLYNKKPRLSASSELNEQDAAFHESLKPSFANNGTIVYAVPGATKQISGELTPALQPLIGEHREVRFARWVPPPNLNTVTLGAQQDVTIIQELDGFPRATTSANVDFMRVAETVSETDPDVQEYAIWHLAGILFDPVNIACCHLIDNMTEDQVNEYETRLRMDAVTEFCSHYVAFRVDEQVRAARTAEEKALIYLTKNDISSACEVLAQAKDFRLATLVAQLPGSDESRQVMQNQIEVWRDRNDWSEMSEPVRALYSILAGRTCIVPGKKGPAEDRATEFNLASHFGFNWVQSFGLRLYFGGFDDLDAVIDAYVQDRDSLLESVPPVPWWCNDANDGREDTLLGLLRLYTGLSKADLPALFDAKTITGSAVCSRLAWQLATLFRAKKYSLPLELMDRLSVNFASELEAAGKFVTATWVLLHVHRAGQRESTVQALLDRNAAKIPEPNVAGPEDDTTTARGVFEFLTQDNRIPASLCWSAKALHARAQLGDPGLQTLYLLHAGRVDDAHDVLCSTVGPAAVIEKELDDLLLNLVSQFPATRKPVGWAEGGEVFELFARLLRLNAVQRDGNDGRRIMAALARGLRAMAARTPGMGLAERVAVAEMRRVLSATLREAGDVLDAETVWASVGAAAAAGVGGRGDAMDVDGKADGIGAFARYQLAMQVGA